MSIETEIAAFGEKLDNIKEDVGEIKVDQKQLLAFQVKTEERLARGVKSFHDHQEEMEVLDQRVDTLNDSHIKLKARVPRGWVVYAIMMIGFAAMMAVLTFRSNQRPAIHVTTQAKAAETSAHIEQPVEDDLGN